MLKFIVVPQGCYAEINPSTSKDVLGLCTFGLYGCCPIIVANLNSARMILCHADGYMVLPDSDGNTALDNADYGIPAWIRRVCPDGDYHNLKIHVGENKGEESSFFNQVQRSIEAVVEDQNNQPIICFIDARSLLLCRDDCSVISSNGLELADINQMISENYGDDIETSQIGLPEADYYRFIGGRILNARDRALKKYGENDQHPICIFRGSSFLSINEMQEENKAIKFGRVIRDKTIDTDSDSSDERSSYSGLILESILKPVGLQAVEAGGEGNCFFYAIARQLEINNSKRIITHDELRGFAIQYMLDHPNQFQGFTEESLDDYIAEMSQDHRWADNPIMQALADEFAISITIYHVDRTTTEIIPTDSASQLSVIVAYTGNHYLSVEEIVSRNIYYDDGSILEEMNVAFIASGSINQDSSSETIEFPVSPEPNGLELINNTNHSLIYNNDAVAENLEISLELSGLISDKNSDQL